jgi:TrmH family RNA methyltransferase
VVHLIYSPEFADTAARDLAEKLESAGADCVEVPAGLFASISRQQNPSGIAFVAKQRWETLQELVPGPHDIWLAVAEVHDPGNLGSIMRTSQAVGAQGVILVEATTDPYHPLAVRASTGAVFCQRLVRASFESLARWKLDQGCAFVGTSPRAGTDYRTLRYPRPLTVLVGGERTGLEERAVQLCDLVISIPMAGGMESLNVAVAAGVVLYEVFSQQRSVPSA